MSKRWSYKTFNLAGDNADERMTAAGAAGFRVVFVTPPATATNPAMRFYPLAVMEREEPSDDKEQT